jgi:putative oxidoreductase
MKKLLSIRYSDHGISFAALMLRLALGGLMIPHGYNKLIHFASMSSKFADPFHIGSSVTLGLVIFSEFFCAVFILLGLFTRLACIPLIINMAGAVFYVHKGDFFNTGEKATLYLFSFIALLFMGPGKVSMDKFIGK